MEKISLEHHPDFIAVIDGRHDLKAAFWQARMAILDPENQAVVIVRDHSALADSHARGSRFVSERSPINASTIRAWPEGGVYRASYYCGVRDDFTGAAMTDHIGPDFTDVYTAAPAGFPEMAVWQLRAISGAAANAHLDTGRAAGKPETLANIFGQPIVRGPQAKLPGGVTVTMTSKGGGTLLAEAHAGNVARGENRLEEPAWVITERPDILRVGWQVADGDVAVLRADDWPEDILPTIHSATPSDDTGDEVHRLVTIGIIHTVDESVAAAGDAAPGMDNVA